MSKPKVLVIGSNSFSGSHFVAEALRAGHAGLGREPLNGTAPRLPSLPLACQRGGHKPWPQRRTSSFQAIDLNSQLNDLLELIDRVNPNSW